jgi:hypothetical protein
MCGTFFHLKSFQQTGPGFELGTPYIGKHKGNDQRKMYDAGRLPFSELFIL